MVIIHVHHSLNPMIDRFVEFVCQPFHPTFQCDLNSRCLRKTCVRTLLPPNPPGPSADAIDTLTTFTAEQKSRNFDLYCQKMQEQKDSAAAHEAELELECTQKESEARIVPATTAATTAAAKTTVHTTSLGSSDDGLDPFRFDDPPASYLSTTPGSTIVKSLAWYFLSAETRKHYQTGVNSYETLCMFVKLSPWHATVYILEEWLA